MTPGDLPPALGPAFGVLDRFSGKSGALERWCAALPAGADLSSLPSRLLVWLLLDQVGKGGDAVARLHDRLLAGDSPSRAEWSAARAEALATTDSAADDATRLRSQIVEAAAWDPARAPSVLQDSLLPWLMQVSTGALASAGWTAEHSVRATELGRAAGDAAAADPFDRLATQDAALAAHMRRAADADRAAVAQAIATVSAKLASLAAGLAPRPASAT